jgi:hypothetical protein
VRAAGVGPAKLVWKTSVIPFHYASIIPRHSGRTQAYSVVHLQAYSAKWHWRRELDPHSLITNQTSEPLDDTSKLGTSGESRTPRWHGTRVLLFQLSHASIRLLNTAEVYSMPYQPTFICAHCQRTVKRASGVSNPKFCNIKCLTANKQQTLVNEWLRTGLLPYVSTNKRSYIKRYLLNEQNHRCAECQIPDEWQGHELIFVLDHINGDSENNQRINLRLLCPNCNSQTSTFTGRNIGKGRKWRREMERIAGIGPASERWQRSALPLSNIRV